MRVSFKTEKSMVEKVKAVEVSWGWVGTRVSYLFKHYLLCSCSFRVFPYHKTGKQPAINEFF